MNKTSVVLVQITVGLLLSQDAQATHWYVDNAASGNLHDGRSWQTAWLNPVDVVGVQPGDTVYISGGPSGSSQTYRNVITPGLPGDDWHPVCGAPGRPITYTVGQDPEHNGMVIFDGNDHPSDFWLGYPDWNTETNIHDVIISGDARDGRLHFIVRNYGLPVQGDCAQNLRISYVDFGQSPDGPLRFLPSHGGIEIDHCHAHITGPAADHFSHASFDGTSWDQNSAHDNVIYLPRNKDNGYGADGFQWSGSGFSIHDNTIVGYDTEYTGGQHQDGLQPLHASYVKIYNNTIVNMGNAAIFLDGYGGDFTHVWVYNNVVLGGGFGITAGPDSGAMSGMGRWPNFTNVVIANNTIADTWDIQAGVGFGIDPYIEESQHVTVTSTFTDCVVSNNVVINAAGFAMDPAITNAGNVTLSASEAPPLFVEYASHSTHYDLHLVAASSALIQKGVNLSPYFIVDRDGNPRPTSGAWDVGAYQYCGDHCTKSDGGIMADYDQGSQSSSVKDKDAPGCGCMNMIPSQGAAGVAVGMAVLVFTGRRTCRRRKSTPIQGSADASRTGLQPRRVTTTTKP